MCRLGDEKSLTWKVDADLEESLPCMKISLVCVMEGNRWLES